MDKETPMVVTPSPVNYDVEISTLTPQQTQREKDFLNGKDSPYWKSQHPDHARAKERMQKLMEREFPESPESQNLSESDRQLLRTLKDAGLKDQIKGDEELEKTISEAPDLVEYKNLQEINRAIDDLNKEHGRNALSVIEGAQNLMKVLKGIGVSDKALGWLDQKLGNNAEALTLMNQFQKLIEKARSEDGGVRQKNQVKTKQEILAEAKRLLKEGE